jgi:S-adenosylmethionine:tRNA ribosyltransferase-isomerase
MGVERRRRVSEGAIRWHRLSAAALAGRFPYHARVQRHDFAYELPPDLIAQIPLAERSASRLLVLDSNAGLERHDDALAAPITMRATAGDGAATIRSEATAAAATIVRSGAGTAAAMTVRNDTGAAEGRGQRGTSGSTQGRTLRDCTMRDFPSLLRPGDLLVFNDTKVVPARLLGSKPSGGRVEVFLERVVAEVEDEALVQLRASKPIREGLKVTTPGGIVRILGREDDLWRVGFPAGALEFFERWGDVPLPPYIHRAADSNDRERYQSIFARERGAVAAPTASLHFDSQLIREIEAMGVNRAFVTLHVGAGTFQPVRIDDLDAHVMHAERVSVSAATCRVIEETRARGGSVVAVGTTVIRALESAALANPASVGPAPALAVAGTQSEASAAPRCTEPLTLPENGWSGETRLFIRPGFQFKVADALLTNFHLPQSTLLMLVCAFAGMSPVLAAYEHAVRAKYRFFSYGDAMFLQRSPG